MAITVNVDGVGRNVPTSQVNIDGIWRDVETVSNNVDGAWKVSCPNYFTITADNRNMVGYTDETTELNIPKFFVGEDNIKYKVTGIDSQAFRQCSNLISVNIPNSVTFIESAAFANCTSLSSINLPNSITRFGTNVVFYGCTSLTSIIIPNSISDIPEATFQSCTSLAEIVLPNSITSIGTQAFFKCDNLTTVYYTGTEEQWNAITVSINNDPLINATKVFNYTG